MTESSNKRSADVDVAAGNKKKTHHCERCNAVDEMCTWKVTHSLGTDDAFLCKNCTDWVFVSTAELQVINCLDDFDGLPELMLAQDDPSLGSDGLLGSLPDMKTVKASDECNSCCSIAAVELCFGMRAGCNGDVIKDTQHKRQLCIRCRVCDACGDAIAPEEGIDVDTVNHMELCEECALWCEFHDCFHGRDGTFQKAEDDDGGALCPGVCCSCQEKASDLKHPYAQRWYCVECVLADRALAGDANNNNKRGDWASLKQEAQKMAANKRS